MSLKKQILMALYLQPVEFVGGIAMGVIGFAMAWFHQPDDPAAPFSSPIPFVTVYVVTGVVGVLVAAIGYSKANE